MYLNTLRGLIVIEPVLYDDNQSRRAAMRFVFLAHRNGIVVIDVLFFHLGSFISVPPDSLARPCRATEEEQTTDEKGGLLRDLNSGVPGLMKG